MGFLGFQCPRITVVNKAVIWGLLIGIWFICTCEYASGGDDRVNIAIGKPYTCNIEPNYTLTKGNAGNVIHLTRGQLSDGHWLNGSTVVWQGGESVVITLDLAEPERFNELNIRATSYPLAGIDPVHRVAYMASNDGRVFRTVGVVDTCDVKGEDIEQVNVWEMYNFRLVDITEESRFVRIEFDYSGFLCLDQIQVIRGVSKQKSKSERPWEMMGETNPDYLSIGIEDDDWRPDLEGSIWKQEEFVIGLWWPPPVAHTNVSAYDVLAEAGFNLIVGGNDVSGEYRKRMLQIASQVGMKCLVNPPPTISEIPDYVEYDSLMGFLIKDEPLYNELELWGEKARSYQKEFGNDYVAAIDVLPSYAVPQWLGYSYQVYVDKAVRAGSLPLLMVNVYPLKPDGSISPDFFHTMEVMRKCSLRYDIPWWSFMQNARVQWSRTPIEPEIRWQAYMLIAYGAKGLLYYCYWEDVGHSKTGPFPDAGIAGALVDSKGKTKENYLPVKRLNEELIQNASFLMRLRSKEISYYGIALAGTRKFSEDKEWGSLTASGPLAIGEFEEENAPGKVRCLVLVNADMTFSNSVTVRIESQGMRTYQVHDSDTPRKGILEIVLGPGDGIVIEVHTQSGN